MEKEMKRWNTPKSKNIKSLILEISSTAELGHTGCERNGGDTLAWDINGHLPTTTTTKPPNGYVSPSYKFPIYIQLFLFVFFFSSFFTSSFPSNMWKKPLRGSIWNVIQLKTNYLNVYTYVELTLYSRY